VTVARLHPGLAPPVTPQFIADDVSKLLQRVAADAVGLWFDALVKFVARVDVSMIRQLWQVVEGTSDPVLSGSSWDADFTTMSVIAAGVMLPLLCVAAMQAVARQDASGLLRTAFVRVPLALLLTAVVVELVSLGMQVTDQACTALMDTGSRSLHGMFTGMTTYLTVLAPIQLSLNFLCLVVAGFLAFVVWIELAVRSAAVAVATLFLPLALAGSALPATSHWARRLGETLTALVLSKLAIVAVLVLATGAVLDTAGGLSSLVEGVTLFGLAAIAPLALGRMLPMIEAGAVAHLDGLGRQGLRAASRSAGSNFSWVHDAARQADGGSDGADSGSGTGVGPRAPSSRDPMPAPAPAAPPGTSVGGDAGGATSAAGSAASTAGSAGSSASAKSSTSRAHSVIPPGSSSAAPGRVEEEAPGQGDG
jgi:hypothetical protein